MSNRTEDQLSDNYYDLGTHTRKVTTNSDKAQLWFNRGLIWTYAFNHEEAAFCFEHAIAQDPSCAMAYWGLAYALGPNYNKPWESFDDREFSTNIARTHQAITQAEKYASTTMPVERALIGALQYRYQTSDVGNVKECSIWNDEYAHSMGSVYHQFIDDLDVATLYTDALMNLTPWKLWNIRTSEPAAGARTLDAKAVLERALKQDDALQHPGILHLYIHLMEMSGTPELALNTADCLRGLIPDAGHLQHMPTHLDILCGDYRRAIASNSDAIHADAKYLSRAGSLNFYSLYRCHNYHFRIYAAMFAGQSKAALDTVAQLEASLPEDLLRVESPPMADWLEAFLSIRVHVLIRFGLWDGLISLQLPPDMGLYFVTTAMIHYGKGVAYAATGKVEEAKMHCNLFEQSVTRVPSTRTLFNNTCLDILAVAKSMLHGEINYRQGEHDVAFEQFSKAIVFDDNLPYDEPWGWMQPTRHSYGALLLERGHVEEAADVYRADLGLDDTLPRAHQHPNNIWSLHGYHNV